jgi:sugar lactone lactonase YvrE
VDIIIPGENWQLLGEGYKFTEGPAPDTVGNVYFTDVGDSKIYKINPEGKIELWVEQSFGANGLMFGPDGRLYAVQGGKKRIAAYDTKTKADEEIAGDIEGNDLAIAHDGGIYVTEPGRHQLTYISPKVVDTGLRFPNGLTLTPDQGQLIVADMQTMNLYAYRVEPDGSLSNKSAYYTCEVPAFATDCGADGIKVDAEGRLYVTSHMGLQVFDQAGRVNAIISKPQRAWLANVSFGGKDMDHLYVTCHDKVYRRKVKSKGVHGFAPPVLPPQPKL